MHMGKLREEIEELRKINEEIYAYMAPIPARAWTRHAFNAVCKSNMLCVSHSTMC